MKHNEIEKIFKLQDHAKKLLFNSTNSKQEECARKLLTRIAEGTKQIYIN